MDETVAKDSIAEGVQHITLQDMHLEYDLDEILIDHEEGAERELACYIVQQYYERRLDDFESKPTDNRLKDRVLTEAKWHAIDLITNDLPPLVERSKLYMLMEADETGWYRKMEYKDLTELMMSMLDETDAASEKSDWSFIVEKMVPAARAFGIDPTVFGNASHQIGKLRGSVPTARVILERHESGDLSDEEAREDLHWLIENVADPQVSKSKLKPELDRYRGIIPDSEVEVKGHIYMTGDESAVLLIPVSNRKELRVIEQRLKKRVDFSVADYKQFAETALELLDIKEDGT